MAHRILYFLGTIDLLLTIIGYIYYRYNFIYGKTWWFGLLYLVFSINMLATFLLPTGTPHFIMKLSELMEGLYIAFGFYTILLVVTHLVIWIISKIIGWNLPSHIFTNIGLAAIIAVIGIGAYRALHPIIRNEVITTNKLEYDAKYKVILLTDVHLSRFLDREYADKLVSRINEQQADIVVIAGDLINERISYVEETDAIGAFKNVKTKKGTYLAFGNHDYIDNPSLWQKIVEANNIQVLRDEEIIIDEKIKITGLNDFSRNRDVQSLVRLAEKNNLYYNIILDHQPRKMDAAATAGYDLYLAGHTHTGQMWPLRQITERMYKLDFGRKDFGKMTAITSSGYGFWGPPVRTEEKPEMVVIEIRGTK